MQSLVRFLLSGVCHQAPAHCLQFEGRPLPLCARCTGMFVGAALTLLGLWLMGQGRRSRLPSWRVGLVMAGLASLWMVDGANSLLFTIESSFALYRPSNVIRLISGVGMGLVLGIVLYPVYHLAFWHEVDGRRVLDEGWPFCVLVVVGALGALGMLQWSSAPYLLWFWAVAAAVFFVFSLVNACLVSLLWNKSGFVTRWWQVLPHLPVGLILSLLEMTAFAILCGFLLS